MEARKRKREEAKSDVLPNIQYKLPHDNRFHAILSLLDSGSLHLYCEPDGIHIGTPALHQAAVFVIHCPYDITTPTSLSYEIAVDQETLCTALREVSAVGVTYMHLGVFEEVIQLSSFNKQDREVMHARVSAMAADHKKPLKIPPFVYGISMETSANQILDVLPSGKEITLSLEQHRLKIMVNTSCNLTTCGFFPLSNIKPDTTFEMSYGELTTKLIRAVLDSFKKGTITLQLGSCEESEEQPPITIKGTYHSSTKEYMEFLVEGQEKD